MDVPVELRLEKAILRQNIVSPMDSSQRQSPSPLKQSLNGEPARAPNRLLKFISLGSFLMF